MCEDVDYAQRLKTITVSFGNTMTISVPIEQLGIEEQRSAWEDPVPVRVAVRQLVDESRQRGDQRDKSKIVYGIVPSELLGKAAYLRSVWRGQDMAYQPDEAMMLRHVKQEELRGVRNDPVIYDVESDAIYAYDPTAYFAQNI